MLNKVTDRAWILSRLEHRVLGWWYRNFASNKGIDIMDEDWDTLILLDACRYDTLLEVAPDDWPEIQKVQSKASNTYNFYLRNFREGPYHDTVVVTAQPRTVQLREEAFHEVIPVYKDEWEERGTVPPETMARRTAEAHDRFPEKRVLSHWIQPHYPFIGSDEFAGYKFDEESVWRDLKRGKVEQSDEDVYRAYRQTLELALPHVSEVIDAITGKTVVSSDHGNVFGIRKFPYPFKIYGPPRDILIPELTEVPWVVFENGSRRKVTEEFGDQDGVDRSDINDKLSDLGYLE